MQRLVYAAPRTGCDYKVKVKCKFSQSQFFFIIIYLYYGVISKMSSEIGIKMMASILKIVNMPH